jgi:CRISPR-associated protein Csm4
METVTLRLEPLAAFGTPLLGDTLFGQLCWAARQRYGVSRLDELLDGYTVGRPFAVVSDAFPEGYLPRPALPLSWFRQVSEADRKAVKKRFWLPLNALDEPMRDWLAACRSDKELAHGLPREAEGDGSDFQLIAHHPQPHNTINRLTGTTGRGDFAPYNLMQRWHAPGLALNCRVVFDPERIGAGELARLFDDIGNTGFGRDASIGLGKFRAVAVEAGWPRQAEPNACLTLAPCAPQGLGFDRRRSFYEVFTRFGRHGPDAVHLGNPFKTPVLLARAGAVFVPRSLPQAQFIGQGIGGGGELSKSVPETVQQGYAPCVPVHLPDEVVV